MENEYKISDEQLKIMSDYYAMMDGFYKEANDYNLRILKAIESVKGKAFKKNLLVAIEECEASSAKWAIVKEPKGDFVSARYGRSIPGYWCDQRNVGYEGDSFEGTVSFKLKEKMYLEVPYSC